MTLGTAAAVVGAFAAAVIAWGAFISAGSARHGPRWARRRLAASRLLPWALGVGAAAFILLTRPWWVGAVIAYMAVVVGWLRRWALRSVDQALAEYGEPPASQPVPARTVGMLGVAAGVIAVLSLVQIIAGGWVGALGLAAAASLAGAAVQMRRRA